MRFYLFLFHTYECLPEYKPYPRAVSSDGRTLQKIPETGDTGGPEHPDRCPGLNSERAASALNC